MGREERLHVQRLAARTILGCTYGACIGGSIGSCSRLQKVMARLIVSVICARCGWRDVIPRSQNRVKDLTFISVIDCVRIDESWLMMLTDC